MRRGFTARRGFIAKRAILATVCVLPLAVLIALLTTGVMSHQMFGDAGRWVAWALRASLQSTDPPSASDNAFVRFDGTGGVNCQNSGVICDDSNYVGINTASPTCQLHVVKSAAHGSPDDPYVLVAQSSYAAGAACAMGILCDAEGTAMLSFGYTNSPANPAVASLLADLSTSTLNINAPTTNFDCGQKVKRTAVSGTYTVLTTDYYLGITATSAFTITLPSAATAGAGRTYVFKKENGTSFAVTLTTSGGEQIDNDNDPTTLLTSGWASLTIVSNGSNWFITSKF